MIMTMNKAQKRELNARRGRAIAATMMEKFTDKDDPRRRVVDVVGSERALARLLGCSYTSIGEYFRGEVAIPKGLDVTFRLMFPQLKWWKWPGGVAK